MFKNYPSYTDYLALFQKHGGTDQDYLFAHYSRFCATQKLFYEDKSCVQGCRLLDIGAHWLHQALLYALDGFKVTAADFPITIQDESVKRLAQEHAIELISYQDLSHPIELAQLAENSFDVILFTEIIEHITFNPVAMWKELYRVLSPRGKIIVTTPNYYYYKGRVWDLNRFLSREGGGLPVHEILTIHTYGHHWKEFSAREIKHYFHLLSPDFRVDKLRYVDFYETSRYAKRLEKQLGFLLKSNIYAEIELLNKDKGIIVQASWTTSQATATQSILEKELSIVLSFIPPHTLSWRVGPYTEGQYGVYSSIDDQGTYLNEPIFFKLPVQEGRHVFQKSLSAPFTITVTYHSSTGWEIFSPPLTLDPHQLNAQGIVELTWQGTLQIK